MRKAFTLIELLIVVAIIAILAAIAVPNFLEAQVRAKVSRTKNDLRTLATGIESYRIDNNNYPTDAGNGASGIYRPYAGGNVVADPVPNYSIGYELTTPIAYLSSVSPLIDIFKAADAHKYQNNPSLRGREYYNFSSLEMRYKAGKIAPGPYRFLSNLVGSWVVMGAGPDKFVNNNAVDQRDFSSLSIPRGKQYDPTNGTVSNGDIYRSQKYGDGMPERGLP